MASTVESQKRGGEEKLTHSKYMKEFRVNQCKLFPLHKCPTHRPYTCFNWHFPNQRRRSSVKKKDGTFNFSADTYCTKYDESKGTCPEGDDCPFLHKTAGDTEKRYHIRYYKTSMCLNGTDSRGHCTQNGIHCGFAHGDGDKRSPVFEASVQSQTNHLDPESGNKLDKDRMMAHDHKWQDLYYVLRHYKTEECNREPRTCGQGYTCPQYHNFRDRRRAPHVHKYKTTPCPNVKIEDDWGEPSACKLGDKCTYCHTRTEQQFHPDIYKSIKCNDMKTNNYCPRGQFCAFSHDENEKKSTIGSMKGRTLVEILSSPSAPKQQQQQQRPPPPPIYIPQISESNNFFNPCVPSYAAVASTPTPDSNKSKMNELLKESSVEDSPMNKDEVDICLVPVEEVGVEQDEQQESVPTPINIPDPTYDLVESKSKPDSSHDDDLENLDNVDNEGGSSSVSADEQSVHNDMNEEEVEPNPSPLLLPPLMPTFLMFSQRDDLTYLSLETLREYQQSIQITLDAVNKALNVPGSETSETPP